MAPTALAGALAGTVVALACVPGTAAAAAATRIDPPVGSRALTRSALPSGRTTYRRPADLQADLDALVAGHPGLVRAVTLPRRSIQGRSIAGVEIAADVNRSDDGRPVFFVGGLTHAREWPSAEVAMEFALDLVAHQGEARVAALLQGLRIVVVPVLNPDGYLYSRGTAVGGQVDPVAADRRRNCRPLRGDPASGGCATARGVDLNRNYGAFWGGRGASTSPASDTYRGSGPWSEPEAAAVHEFTQTLPVTGVQSLHNVGGLVLRPPGFRGLGRAPDEARLKALGDAMGRATGYESRYGYDLYEVTGALEDWNYVAQGAFGYTVELGGSSSADTSFQGTYSTHVVDQYVGRVGTPSAGKGMREALLLASEAAMDARDHVVLRGGAPGGAVLHLRKRFDTTTSPLCSDTFSADACGPTRPAFSTPDGLDNTLDVPQSGTFRWHAGPSTRPFERKAGRRETWTLSCRRSGAGTVTKAVFADRGQTVDVDPCDPASLPRAAGAPSGPQTNRVSVSPRRDRAAVVRRAGHLRVRATCPVTCRATVTVTAGTRTVASRVGVSLRGRRVTTVAVPLTAAGRRIVAGSSARRALRVSVRFRSTAGSTATFARSFSLTR